MRAKRKPFKHTPERRGRPLIIGGVLWRWRIGKGMHVVAYSEQGERRCSDAATIKGVSPSVLERGQLKRTSDGMLRPSEVGAWLAGAAVSEDAQIPFQELSIRD